MAVAVMSKIRKKSPYFCNGLNDFKEIWHFDASRPWDTVSQ